MSIKNADLVNCPVTATMEVIGGKWKILILYLVSNGVNRFGKLNMMLKDISKQMLTTQLRDLERDGIIRRVIYPEIPPRVEYFLTDKGEDLKSVFVALREWGYKYEIAPEAITKA